MKASLFRKLLNIWPPFLGAGIKVESLDETYRLIIVSMKLRWFNRNYVNSHFGGSLYAMTDPFYMLMLIHNLGKEYLVWDHSSTIRYIKPGKGKVSATFSLQDDQINALKKEAAHGQKILPTFEVDITDESGEVVAKVNKQVYIRLKKHLRPDTDVS